MEKKLNTIIQEYMTEFKKNVCEKTTELAFDEKDKAKVLELVEFVYDYNRLTLDKEDLSKRKRIKNSIPVANRCVAKRANGEQCTRRRKDECEFCGTHTKGTPHGLFQDGDDIQLQNQKVEVFAEDIKGIVYYIDRYNNVYSTEDVLAGKENPRIVTKAVKVGNIFTIPDFGI
jgi:hypothetical protein